MRYFIYFAYDGTNYHGWQIQPNAHSVQAELNGALSTILRTETMVTGAGRTDTGVHARMMVGHFDADEIDTLKLAEHLNRLLPHDIAVWRIERVADDAHARFDAVSRTYHYDICLCKNPFVRHFATRMYYTLDFDRMNEAAQSLIGTHDFSSFSKAGTDTKTNVCTITCAHWKELEPGFWRFEITANRFLRNMVRAIVGTLLLVGRGKLNPADVAHIIAQRNRNMAGESVPACGLSLVDVVYENVNYKASIEVGMKASDGKEKAE